MRESPECRPGCGACCIAPSISSPIPGMPAGKPAGVPCVNLDREFRCRIFGSPVRPAVCGSLRPSAEMCGSCREEALAFLNELERRTVPAGEVPGELVLYRPAPEEYPALTALWEASVRATHHFLSEADIAAIRAGVPAAFAGVALYCIGRAPGAPEGFCGVSGTRLEMLFLHPRSFGIGVGKRLLRHAVELLHITEVDVNEANENALGFYLHFGFEVAGRSELDSAGRPFPLLHLVLKSGDRS